MPHICGKIERHRVQMKAGFHLHSVTLGLAVPGSAPPPWDAAAGLGFYTGLSGLHDGQKYMSSVIVKSAFTVLNTVKAHMIRGWLYAGFLYFRCRRLNRKRERKLL